MPLLLGLGAFLVCLIAARLYRFGGGGWVPGWTGGIGLLMLFGLAMVAMLALGNPGWLEPLFFAVVGAVVGAYMKLWRGRHWRVLGGKSGDSTQASV